MAFKLTILVSLTIILSTNGSPFQLTEKYVEEFKNKLTELKKLSTEYQKLEESLETGPYDEKQALTNAEEFDFIIVGAGSSGSVLANRLTEVPEWKVLVLEAGGPETEVTQVPAMYPYLKTTPYNWHFTTTPQNNSCLEVPEWKVLVLEAGGPETEDTQVPAMYPYLKTTPYNWHFTTTPQNNSCLGTENNKCAIDMGKSLGGTSAINTMTYTRGNARDFDYWADLGLDGWCWKDVLPYFKKIEDAHFQDIDRKYHNLGGPLHLENFQHSTNLASHFFEAGHEIDLETVDYNGEHQLGLSRPQATSKNGKRNSVAQAYLLPAEGRKNLVVRPLSQVIEILISPHTKEAYGVKYVNNGHLYVVKAAKEVVLTSGGINTPQLLMLSGIGPKEGLEALGIEPLVDLKVGHNVFDHLSFIGLNFVYNSSIAEDEHKDYDEVVDYLKNGKGPLTSVGAEVLGFIKTDASKEKAAYPDIEFLVSTDIYNKGHEHLKRLRIKKDIYDALWAPLEGKKGFTIKVSLLHPKSVGKLTLHDKDPLHQPLLNPNYLSDVDGQDVETILAGIHIALKLAHTESLQKLGITLNHNKVPECEHETDDHYWKCAIKYLTIGLSNISGTAKMGPDTDKEAVVDNKLRVNGVHKLRVVDSSVFPVTISGHFTAAVIMAAEKAADLIKQDWK